MTKGLTTELIQALNDGETLVGDNCATDGGIRIADNKIVFVWSPGQENESFEELRHKVETSEWRIFKPKIKPSEDSTRLEKLEEKLEDLDKKLRSTIDLVTDILQRLNRDSGIQVINKVNIQKLVTAAKSESLTQTFRQLCNPNLFNCYSFSGLACEVYRREHPDTSEWVKGRNTFLVTR